MFVLTPQNICTSWPAEVVTNSGSEGSFILESILLVQILAQSFLDPVQDIGALEAAASPVTTDHDGTKAAHQDCSPVYVKLL